MSTRHHIELDGPHRSRLHQRRARRQLVAVAVLTIALIAGPFIASAIHLFTGG
ncbi:hypothetical protein [Delftia tsuruhatensis]|uniref:hypothetical protein n=1 Tax=Delftia tsuruhatensis TaxID=180282 RepID=UPI000A7ADCE4|nr:hypothetical protein [Delftia tsuruhatensis]